MNETDSPEVLVMLGRIDEKVSHLTAMDERLRKVETDLTELKARQAPKAPWWAVVGGIAGIGSIVLTAVAILGIVMRAG